MRPGALVWCCTGVVAVRHGGSTPGLCWCHWRHFLEPHELRDGDDFVTSSFSALIEGFALATEEEPWDSPAALYTVELGDAAQLADAADAADALAGADMSFAWVLRPLRTLEGHPFDALFGYRVPDSAVGVVLVVEGWARPAPGQVGDNLRRFADNDGRCEVRNVVGVLRDSTVAHAQLVRGGEVQNLGDRTAGRVPSALARTVGAASLLGRQPSPFDIVVRAQSFAALTAAATAGGELAQTSGFDRAHAGDLVAEAVGLPLLFPAVLPTPLQWLVARCNLAWDSIHVSAPSAAAVLTSLIDDARRQPLGPDHYLEASAAAAALEWCDPDLFAHLFDASVPDRDSISALHAKLVAEGRLTVSLADIEMFATRAARRAGAGEL